MIWIFIWPEMQQHATAWYHYEEESFYHLDIMRLYSINICNTDTRFMEARAWPSLAFFVIQKIENARVFFYYLNIQIYVSVILMRNERQLIERQLNNRELGQITLEKSCKNVSQFVMMMTYSLK